MSFLFVLRTPVPEGQGFTDVDISSEIAVPTSVVLENQIGQATHIYVFEVSGIPREQWDPLKCYLVNPAILTKDQILADAAYQEYHQTIRNVPCETWYRWCASYMSTSSMILLSPEGADIFSIPLQFARKEMLTRSDFQNYALFE